MGSEEVWGPGRQAFSDLGRGVAGGYFCRKQMSVNASAKQCRGGPEDWRPAVQVAGEFGELLRGWGFLLSLGVWRSYADVYTIACLAVEFQWD